jgi:hypothetical protein
MNNTELEHKLSNVNIEIQQCIMMFNSLLKDLSEILIKQFSEELILTTSYEILREILINKPQEPIMKFILNVYKNKSYRENIINGNDDFFRNSKNINNLDDKIKLFFQFRNYWDKLSNEKQIYFKNVLKTMIEISELYIVKRDDGNIIMENMLKLQK